MRTLKISLFAMLFILLIPSCGPSVTVTDSWHAPDIEKSKSDNFLVMARVDDMAGRQRFEQEISNQLRAGGMQASESYIKYPDLNLNMKMSPAEIDELEEVFAKDGINGIVLTVIKDVKTEIKTTSSGGYHAGYYPYFDGYYGSFYSPYGYGGAYVPASQRTYESDIYKLETVVFDLNRKGDQMVAIVSIKITDPNSASEVAAKYAEKVAGEFEDGK